MKASRFFLRVCIVVGIFTSSAFAQGKNKSSCAPDITNLQITFADSAGDMFRSDGLGPYVSGKSRLDNTQIQFQRANCTFDLTMNLTKRTMKLDLGGGDVRNSTFVNFDRVASVPVTNEANPDFKVFCGGSPNDPFVVLDTPNVFPAFVPFGEPYTFDNYAGCGRDPDGSYFVRRVVAIPAGTLNGADYTFRFQNSPIDIAAARTLGENTSYIRVYHPSQYVWKLSPEEVPLPSWGVLLSQSSNLPPAIAGYYSIPFRIRLEQIN